MAFLQNIRKFSFNTSGVTLAVFAIVIPMMIGAAGVAIDLSRAYLVKKRLGQSVDAAVLAVAGSSGSDVELEAKMNAYININFTDDRFATILRTDLYPTDDEMKVEAEARSMNYFMKAFGKDYIDVYVESTVKKELRGIETVLVMDNTGSMSRNNNIATLRTAAKDFVNIMFDRAPDPSVIKIGLVPYSTSVNVGRYGLGLKPDGSQYGDGTPFVNNPHGLSYTTSYNSSNGWLGCVTEDEPTDTTDHNGPWEMYRFCRDGDDNYDYGCYYRYRRPNYVCPTSYVTPLSSDRGHLLTRIDTMNARGHTLGNYGMVWGWRLISPEFPFIEGASWNHPDWKKSVIMMTDGQNTMHPYYSAYGATNSHAIRTTQENEKLEEVCEAMKDDGIIVYTITFTSSINSTTKDYYRECATDETKYYDAPSKDDLVDAFQAISRELSNLYITQ